MAGRKRGRLAQAWDRAAHHARKGAATAALAFAFLGAAGGVAGAQHLPQAHTPVAAALLEKSAKPQKEKYEYSQARLDKIEGRMRQTALGRDLLQFAADQDITISLSDSRTMDFDTKDRFFVKGRNYSTYILVNGETKNDDEIMMTIAHELRHSWHERVIKSGDLELNPRQHWLMRRMQEADAFAYEIHFGYEYEKATGKQLDVGDRYNACDGSTPFTCLVDQYRAIRSGNKPVEQAYGELLQKTLAHAHAMNYDTTFTGPELESGWKKAIDHPEQAAAYANLFENTTTDAAFVDTMRRVFTAGLDPDHDPRALAAWTDADFMSFDKTGGRDKAGLKRLAQAESDFAKAKTSWADYKAKQAAPEETPPQAAKPAAVPPPAGPSA